MVDGNLGGVLHAIDRIQKGAALLPTLVQRGVGNTREYVISWSDLSHHPEGYPSAA